MNDIQRDVEEFMIACDQPMFDITAIAERKFSLEMLKQVSLGIDLINEEVNNELLANLKDLEYLLKHPEHQVMNETVVSILSNILDGVVDSVYVMLWTLNVLGGLPFKEAWNEVQKANMSKAIKQPDGTYKVVKNENGKVQKPEGWLAPDVLTIVGNHIAKKSINNG